jgi:hypothetical protein
MVPMLGVTLVGLLTHSRTSHAQAFRPDPIDPFLVNTLTDGGQELADVSAAASGFVIVWESDAEFNEKIVGQRFDENGNRVGEDFLVGAGEESFRQPAVARASDFVVVWEAGTANQNIVGQLFDAQGQPAGVAGLVNTYTEDEQNVPEVASDAQGNFVVVYQSFKWPGDGDGEAIVGKRYASNAAPQGPEFLINQATEDDQEDPSVGRQPGGDFLVAWESQDTDLTGIFARIFAADGAPKGNQFQVNNVGDGSQESPSVGAWADGYVVVFMSDDEEGKGIWARRFDSDGNPLGAGQFLVNNIQDLDQRAPAVAAFDGGEFVVVWEDDDFGVAGREFDTNGEPVGGQFQVGFSDKMEERPRIALRDGGFLITWYGAGEELDNDVFARNYVLPEPGETALGLAALSTLAALARLRRPRA